MEASEKGTTVHNELYRIRQRIVAIESRFQGIATQEQSLTDERAALEKELVVIYDETFDASGLVRALQVKHD